MLVFRSAPDFSHMASITPQLNEWVSRVKAKKEVKWEQDAISKNGLLAPAWICTLTLSGSSLSIPLESFTSEAHPKKAAAEMECCKKAWEWLEAEGFINEKTLRPIKKELASSYFSYLPRQKSPSSELIFIDVAIGSIGSQARAVVELHQPLTMAPISLSPSSLCLGSIRGLLLLPAIPPQVDQGSPIEIDQGTPKVNSLPAFSLNQDTTTGQVYLSARPIKQLEAPFIVLGMVIKGFGLLLEAEAQLIGNESSQVSLVGWGSLEPSFDLEGIQPLTDHGFPLWPEDGIKEGIIEAQMRLKIANNIRVAANERHRERDYATSARLYTIALRFLDRFSLREETEFLDEKQMGDDLSICLLNRSASNVKLGSSFSLKQAAHDCRTVLLREPDNAKALYRLGEAMMGLRSYESALTSFTEAARLQPQDPKVRESIAFARVALAKEKEKNAAALAQLWSKGESVQEDQILIGDGDEDESDLSDLGGLSEGAERAFEALGSLHLEGHGHS